MKIDLVAEGLLDRRRFSAWQGDTRKAIHTAVARAMRDTGKVMAERARGEMRAGFKVVKPKFLRSMHAKVFDRKAKEFPALYIGSKVPWLGIHEQGGTIRGRMLVPLLPQHRRIGRKAFARVIDALMRSGNAFFIENPDQPGPGLVGVGGPGDGQPEPWVDEGGRGGPLRGVEHALCGQGAVRVRHLGAQQGLVVCVSARTRTRTPVRQRSRRKGGRRPCVRPPVGGGFSLHVRHIGVILQNLSA